MYDLLTRIHKALCDDIKLVYFTEDIYGYVFFVLGCSGFIYKIIINKKYQRCNCEDYYNHKFLCKHILFILFKVIRLYRCTINHKLYLINFDPILYKYKDFLYKNHFQDLDWILFKKYYTNLNLKKNYFNIDLSNKFKDFYRKYNYIARKNFEKINKECPICLQKTNYAIKCDICKTFFHVECIFNWLNSKVTKRCPICRCDCWGSIYPYYQLLKNCKIPLNSII